MTRRSIYKLLFTSAAMALGIKAWRVANAAGPRVIATSSLAKHERSYIQSNETPTDPGAQERLDMHFSSRGRPAPPSYRK